MFGLSTALSGLTSATDVTSGDSLLTGAASGAASGPFSGIQLDPQTAALFSSLGINPSELTGTSPAAATLDQLTNQTTSGMLPPYTGIDPNLTSSELGITPNDSGLGTNAGSPYATNQTAGLGSSGLGGGGVGGTGSNPTGGGTIGSALQSILGGLGGLGSLSNLLPLLGVLGPALTGLLNYNKTNQATGQVVQGINNASTAAQNILGQNSPFAPYASVGQKGSQALGNYQFQPINIAPLGEQTPQVPNQSSLSSLLRKGA